MNPASYLSQDALPHLDRANCVYIYILHICILNPHCHVCPFFVVFGINLLSRPEQEWEGIVTVKGVTEPNCYIAQMEKKAFKPITANIKFTCDLRDYLEEVEGRSF